MVETPQSLIDDEAAKASAELLSLVGWQKQQLRDAYRTFEARRDDLEGQRAAVDRARTHWHQRLSAFLDESDSTRTMELPDPGWPWSEPVVQGEGDGYRIHPSVQKFLVENFGAMKSAFSDMSSRRISGKYRKQFLYHLGEVTAMLRVVDVKHDKIAKSIEELTAADQQAMESQASTLRIQCNSVAQRVIELTASAGAAMQPWDSEAWSQWSPGEESKQLLSGVWRVRYLQDMGRYGDWGVNLAVGRFVDRNSAGWRFTHDGEASRDRVVAAANARVLRALAATTPGKAVLAFFDPQRLGQSAAPFLELKEFNPELISGKVWTSTPDLRTLLTDFTSHIENVIQKYLRLNYDTIDDYNRDAGEVSEPYRYLMVHDFPAGFDEETLRELERIVEVGPRCGVTTVLLRNSSVQPGYGMDLSHVERLLEGPEQAMEIVGPDGRGTGIQAFFELDVLPTPGSDTSPTGIVSEQVIEAVGRAGRKASEVTVGLEKLYTLLRGALLAGVRSDLPATSTIPVQGDPATWWQADSRCDVSVPVGQTGARDPAMLRFDSETRSGALLVGRMGSGKSTLLHTYIASATTLYSPEELELHLVDFKEGVEFKGYANRGLPHAVSVAVESDREFGVSVLASIDAELEERGKLFRSTGGEQAGLESYRLATGTALPRIVLVFDEFHVLFSQNDKLGATAAHLLEKLIRQGRSFGIHVILGSQSLSGLDALGRHVLQLLPIRILLPSAEGDATLVLGDGNDAWRHLTRRGEGILNVAGGAVEANQPFQAAFLNEADRMAHLDALRRLADSRGLMRRPVVFDGEGATRVEHLRPEDVLAEPPAGTSVTTQLTVRMGQPMTISGNADIVLRRESGANIALLLRDQDAGPQAALTMLLASVVRTAAPTDTGPSVDVVDFLSIDERVEELLEPFVAKGAVRVGRRRQLRDRLEGFVRETGTRLEEDDYRAPPKVLVLFGIHRARDLDTEGESDDDGENLGELLSRLLRDGPEVGMHTVLWSDTLASLHRRIDRSGLKELAWWVLGTMSPDDSRAITDTAGAASLRNHQALVFNEDTDQLRRITLFEQPSADWIMAALAAKEVE